MIFLSETTTQHKEPITAWRKLLANDCANGNFDTNGRLKQCIPKKIVIINLKDFLSIFACSSKSHLIWYSFWFSVWHVKVNKHRNASQKIQISFLDSKLNSWTFSLLFSELPCYGQRFEPNIKSAFEKFNLINFTNFPRISLLIPTTPEFSLFASLRFAERNFKQYWFLIVAMLHLASVRI
jgi:hypothetical protein